MAFKESDYDFLCTNDTSQIKLAIQGDAFYAVTIQSETAKKLDLSGGTKNLENITLANCFKLTRIIWPQDSGAIKKLAIHSAESLTTLDVSNLSSLDELSLFNCPKLESITGLGKTATVINLHCVNLKSLNLSRATSLDVLNIPTTHTDFAIILKDGIILPLNSLQDSQLKFNIERSTDFIAPILQHKPGPEDMETIIQKYGAIRERNHACIVMISLLSNPDISLELEPELEEQASLTKRAIHDTRAANNYPAIIFLPEVALQIPIRTNQTNRFQNKEEDIVDWLQNPNRMNDDLLILTRNDLRKLEVFNLLKQIEQKRQLLTFMGLQYRYPLTRKIYADFPSRLLKRTAPLLFDNRFKDTFSPFETARPIDAAARNTTLAPELNTNKINADKNISDSVLRRNLSNTLRTLNLRSAMKQTELRYFQNALNRHLELRRKLATISQTPNALTTLGVKPTKSNISNDNKNKIAQPGSPLDSPPTLTDLTDPNGLHVLNKPFDIENIEQDLEHTPKLRTDGSLIDASPSLTNTNYPGADLQDLKKTLDVENIEHNLDRKHKFAADGSIIDEPAALIEIFNKKPSLFSLEQKNKINLSLDISSELSSKNKTIANESISIDPSLINQAEPLSDYKSYLFDIENYALTLTTLCKAAKERALPHELAAEQMLLVEQSVSSVLQDIKHLRTIDLSLEVRPDSLLKAAQDLCAALNHLNKACLASMKNTAEESERYRLISLLTNISNDFLNTHTARDAPLGTFGTGYKAGVDNARMILLTNILNALKDNHPIPPMNVNASLQELMKDKALKTALQSEVESLKQHLTSAHGPIKRK